MTASRTYLDWNATAPLRPEAREAMLAALDLVGNPSSVHREGRAARAIVESARESVAAQVTLSNVGEEPIQIVGGSTDCQCITTKDLPLTLQAGESRAVQVTIRRTGAPGVQRRRYHFFTDQQRQFRASASFVGQVVADPAPTEPRTK